MIGPVERLLVAAARHDEGLPGGGRGDAGNAIQFGLVGSGVDDVGGRGRDQQLDIVVEDQFTSEFGRFVRIGLGVAHQDLDLVGLAVILDAVCQQALMISTV